VNAELRRAKLPEAATERLADNRYCDLLADTLKAAEEGRDDDAYRLAAEWQGHALARLDTLRRSRTP